MLGYNRSFNFCVIFLDYKLKYDTIVFIKYIETIWENTRLVAYLD